MANLEMVNPEMASPEMVNPRRASRGPVDACFAGRRQMLPPSLSTNPDSRDATPDDSPQIRRPPE
jgi:hypothetical protein